MTNEPTPANEVAQQMAELLNSHEDVWPSSWLQVDKGKRDEWFFVSTVDNDGTYRNFEVTFKEVQ